jgi:hypothetical protein
MRRTLLLVPLLALAACDVRGAGTGTSAGGEYRVTLDSPHGAEGAAFIELTGSGIEAIAGEPGTKVFSQLGARDARVVIVAEPAGSLAFRLTLAPGSDLPAARVTSVVDGDDQPRGALASYRVTFSR